MTEMLMMNPILKSDKSGRIEINFQNQIFF